MHRTTTLCALVAIVSLLSACKPADPNAAMEEQNKKTMQAFVDAMNNRSFDKLGDFVDANYTEHTPDPMMKSKGLAGLLESMKATETMLPDFKVKVNWMIAEGDLVMSHYRWTGTNTGSVEGMPATGKAMDVEGVDIIRFKDGKGVEHWGYFDMGKMMEQMGMTWAPLTTAEQK